MIESDHFAGADLCVFCGTNFTVFKISSWPFPAINSFYAVGTIEEGFSMPVTPLKVLPRGKGESLLIVDDENHIRAMVSEILEMQGYEVKCACNGEEALSLYKEAMNLRKPFDLVILDVVMPAMGGDECLMRLMEINPDIKFLLSTGLVEDEFEQRYRNFNLNRVLRKPFMFRELFEKVRTVLEE
jgi:CheY-like chemotaxis protein